MRWSGHSDWDFGGIGCNRLSRRGGFRVIGIAYLKVGIQV